VVNTLTGQVGPKTLAYGDTTKIYVGRTGERVVQDYRARYYESAINGNTYYAAVAATALTASGAVSYKGLCLSNPVGSPVMLAINRCGFAYYGHNTGQAPIGLMVGKSTTNVVHTTPVVVTNQAYNGGRGYGAVDTTATLPVAGTLAWMLSCMVSASNPNVFAPGQTFDLSGSIVLYPGTYCAYYSHADTSTNNSYSFSWEEVAL